MEWISVKDRLPEEEKQVLICIKFGNMPVEYMLDYIIKFEGSDPPYIWACTLSDEWIRITHWMELPEPPNPSSH